MTETLTIRLPRSLAREFKAKARAAKTNPTAVLRQAAADFIKKAPKPRLNPMQEHILKHAGTWQGFEGEALLRRTRP